MSGIKTKQYVKLGTSLRYLIDAREGEPLGGKCIIQCIETVLSLIVELEFSSTYKSSGFKQLDALMIQLKSFSMKNTSITKEQSDELERICRKIRESLLTEGDRIEVVRIDRKHSSQPLEPPDKVTLSWLFTHVPVPLWGAFIGLLIAMFSLGVTSSKFEIVRRIFELEQYQASSITETGPSQPSISHQPTVGRIL